MSTISVLNLVKSIPNLPNSLFNKFLANSYYIMFLEYDFMLYNSFTSSLNISFTLLNFYPYFTFILYLFS